MLGTGEHVDELPRGRLAIADGAGAVGILFGRLAPSHLVTRHTTRTRIFTVRAPGVPAIHVDEAFDACLECLAF
jgi:hypothetical protein